MNIEPPCLCDDIDECTIDTCDSKLGCLHISVECDDNDSSTDDYCDIVLGCQHKISTNEY
jgi:hypothetical protein